MALVHSEGQDRWYFTKEELQRTPSVLSGIDAAKELSYRQQSANLIQDMGQRLVVSQLTINTAIVYMHRFYMFHSFSDMNRNVIAPCCLFLSAKLEEQPRKLEHVIKVANICLQKNDQLDPKSETYLQQAQDLVINESILLQTLGFELTVDHPHTHVVRITQLVRASKDLAQTSYFMATNSLHLTPFCIQHKPSVVACVCIHLACKWSNWEFPRSSDNKDWWEYVDPTVTKQTLDTICQEFLTIIENCPNRLKRRISTVTIYKGGHRPKSAGEKSNKNAAPTNGDTTAYKEESSSKGNSSSKGEQSSSETKADHAVTKESLSNAVDTTEQPNEQSFQNKDSAATLTITSSAAVVETPTSTVMLPPLQPLTTKYASMPGLSSNSAENQTKSSSANAKSSSGNKDNTKVVSGTKHKHRDHDESSTPSKKLKTMHSSSSHSSQSKNSSSSRAPFQSKHNLHQAKTSSHSTPGTHHKLLIKSGSFHSGLPHHSSSPKLPVKSSSGHSSHTHHSHGSSSSHGNNSQTHHSSSKRHSYPGHPTSSHSNSHSSSNKTGTSHKHSNSPLDVKKSSGERHRRPSSSSSKPKADMPGFGTPTSARTNDTDKAKKNQSTEDFASPPGLQRLQNLPAPRSMMVVEKSVSTHHGSSHHGAPLPGSGQGAPPPPPLPTNLPPPPPPPPT